MPEGPAIFILTEEAQVFKGQEILEASGNATKFDVAELPGKKITDIKSWGKLFFLSFDGFFLRIDLMMFGNYRIHELKEGAKPRLTLTFKNGTLSFYSCSILRFEMSPDAVYDYTADVMNPKWSGEKAIKKLMQHPEIMVCDALLDQDIFSGVGNIIKNEVLYRINVHPETLLEALPDNKLRELVNEAVRYSFDFLKWKKEFALKKHWLIHSRRKCKRCNLVAHKSYLGKTKRRTFYCDNCQVLYLPATPD